MKQKINNEQVEYPSQKYLLSIEGYFDTSRKKNQFTKNNIKNTLSSLHQYECTLLSTKLKSQMNYVLI